jgi:TonB family protein
MFMFDTSDLQRIAVSSLGAIAVSAICIGAAVGPAKAATAPLSVSEWQSKVEHKIDDLRDLHPAAVPAKPVKAEVAIRFTADGDFAAAQLLRSTGNATLDARAVEVARRIDYPALPAGLRGQTVRMDLHFANIGSEVRRDAPHARKQRPVQIAAR